MSDLDTSSLRDLMTVVDLPPGRVDVGRAVADGRRRSRRFRYRAVFGALATAAAVLVVAGSLTAFEQVAQRSAPVPVPVPAASPAARPPGCAVETYTQSGSIDAIDEGGQYLVGTGDVSSPVIWRDGRRSPLTGANGSPTAVNRSGVVVGWFDSHGQDQYQGWVWRDGKVTMLGKASGYGWTMPLAINARGDVVGYAKGDGLDVSIPVLWPADRPGTAVKLKLPSGVGVSGVRMSRATGIGDDGTIVGVAKGAPVRWRPDGSASALPLPSAGGNGGYVDGLRGHFAFGIFYGKGVVEILRWDLTTGKVTSLGPDPSSQVSGTADGSVVTWGDEGGPATRISPEGRRIPLTQPDGATGLATAVSGDGATIVGFTAGTTHRPVVWHCGV